jgi:hypothetical protein
MQLPPNGPNPFDIAKSSGLFEDTDPKTVKKLKAMAEAFQGTQAEPMPYPVSQSADLCPACAKKHLSKIMPLLLGQTYPMMGA